jgi:DMSO/TMAO reductase YedYZ molybdopterin-dependent catalytic subunit
LLGLDSERKQLERKMRDAGRLPPGQSLTLKWPVLHVGPVPRFDPATWDFRIFGLVEEPLRLTWAEFTRLPMREVTADMHCVTRWSRFDVRWEGVPFREVTRLARSKPEARYVLVHAEHNYTSNVPLADLLPSDARTPDGRSRAEALFALKHNGEPLPADHGYPVRLVVPHLYAWKSVKWVRAIEFLSEDQLGFWERNGYHAYGDPFREQRFDRD